VLASAAASIGGAYPACRLGRSCCAAVKVAGPNLVRDVLLGVLFLRWTAWWISLCGADSFMAESEPRA
jgi:hypothetical protein